VVQFADAHYASSTHRFVCAACDGAHAIHHWKQVSFLKNCKVETLDAGGANGRELRLPGKMRHIVYVGRPAENAAAQKGNVKKPGDVL